MIDNQPISDADGSTASLTRKAEVSKSWTSLIGLPSSVGLFTKTDTDIFLTTS